MTDAISLANDPTDGAPACGAVAYADIPPIAYAVVTDIKAEDGQEDALRVASIEIVEAVRRNPRNIAYLCQQDWEAPGHFIFYEIWPTQSDFEAHNAMPEVQAFYGKLPHLAGGQPTPVKLRVLT